jgi:hypothetical protein
MSPRRLLRNEARLVWCKACRVGTWLAGALPQVGDSDHLCASCSAAALAALDSPPSAGAALGAASGADRAETA